MKKTLLIIFSFLLPAPFIIAQQASNMTFAARWDDQTLPIRDSLQYNDCWGFAKDGREYAIIGSLTKVHFIEVTNPAGIYQVQNFTNGANSIWRDFKYYSNYIYSVADEGSEGLIVFNVANINNTSNRITQIFQNNTTFQTCHNIWIDIPAGRLYCAGSNNATGFNGLVVFDIKTNPASPTLCANINLKTGSSLSSGYVHDVHVQNGKIYCSHGFNGMHIYDATAINNWQPGNSVISNYTRLGSIQVAGTGYNHSSYLTEDNSKLVMAEETWGKPLRIVDVSVPSNLNVLGTMYSCTECASGQTSINGTSPIVHNPFVKGNLAFLAYYHEGLQVFDISNASLPVKVAYFDTDYPNRATNYADYYGAWGTYPYLPSQRVLISDVLNGLFLVNLTPSLLPIEWVRFNAKQDDNAINLSWTTATERNSAYFEVERSKDGLNFKPIGKKTAVGNSSKVQNYTLIDVQPLKGENYYRIKQVDQDGQLNYSTIEAVDFQKNKDFFSVFPNPNNGNEDITIQFNSNFEDKNGSIQLFNTSGHIVLQKNVNFADKITIREKLPQGVYFIKICMDNEITTKKLVIE